MGHQNMITQLNILSSFILSLGPAAVAILVFFFFCFFFFFFFFFFFSTGSVTYTQNGTYIGLNSGMVTQISADSVIIEEEIENLMGELILQNTEIKLQKPAGE